MSRGRRTPSRARQRAPRGASFVGREVEVEVGPVAHGGSCVARHEGRAVFVRHALPGERVVARITDGTEGDRFWRADAVEVLEASPHRVSAPCLYAGPDACGGCDLQHVEVAHQRDLKAAVVAEQLRRLAGLEITADEVVVEAVPGDVPAGSGLGWRTRQRYATTADGHRAMRKHRSHELVPVEACLLESPRPADHVVRDVAFEVAADGFWQVHPGAPEVLVDTVLGLLDPQPGESALDLYAGVGLFSRFLLDRVGERGSVVAIEGDRAASALTETNASGVTALAGDVARVLGSLEPDPVDLAVLDPPRTGARREVVEQIVRRRPRAVAYVACDPAALARDVAIFAEHGYALIALRAFDLFPMTHHVECVALLTPVDHPSER